MNWFEITFLIVWALLGLWAWARSFDAWFLWWLSSGFIDKILIGITMIVTLAASMALGAVSFAIWRTCDPRNYR